MTDDPTRARLPLFPNSVVSNDIDFIRAGDADAYLWTRFLGRSRQEMPRPDRDALFQDGVWVFEMSFSDGARVEIFADGDFATLAEAEAEVAHMQGPLGKLPGFMRQELSHVVLNIGDHGAFAEARQNFFVVSTANMRTRRAANDMEETFFHEAVHAALDRDWLGRAAWKDAQAADGVFLTDYAASRPEKEDLAETSLFYYAYRFFPGRLDAGIRDAMAELIPARIAFLDGLFLPGGWASVVDDAPRFADARSWSEGRNTWGFWDTQNWMAGDFDGDGSDDVLASYKSGTTVKHRVYLSDGTGSFSYASSWSDGRSTWGFWRDQEWRTGDFDGDGADDVLASYESGATVKHRVYLSDGAGSFSDARSWSEGRATWGFWRDQEWMTGDFDGDGDDDVLATYRADGQTKHRVYLSDGTGSFSNARSWSDGRGTGAFDAGQTWRSGDFDGDGSDDVLATFADRGEVRHRVFLSDGTGSFSDAQDWSGGAAAFAPEQRWMTGDFDGDGDDDVLSSFGEGGRAALRVETSPGADAFLF
ncbi:FG-GAP-like repeat-containing protein [Jannaschia formosa]|uniref:FG-GAP-like repeat-containing protein n=1 Tax=Jannaschia formosa TaxID=2259592 RepID=UPI000E1BA9E8|nr:FG-GAP-like repeat-containing protein [Jannaschia formosa]TFL16685.1 hypothetical protein DR046_18585 [Jannaschia formosa]